jgi:hypothetical protein
MGENLSKVSSSYIPSLPLLHSSSFFSFFWWGVCAPTLCCVGLLRRGATFSTLKWNGESNGENCQQAQQIGQKRVGESEGKGKNKGKSKRGIRT